MTVLGPPALVSYKVGVGEKKKKDNYGILYDTLVANLYARQSAKETRGKTALSCTKMYQTCGGCGRKESSAFVAKMQSEGEREF